MAAQNGRRQSVSDNQDCQRNPENVDTGLGSTQGQGLSVGHDSYSTFHPDSERGNKNGAWTTFGGQTTTGGIHRRLKELHKACSDLIKSQQQYLEISLREGQGITAEMQNLQALLAETLDDIPDE